MIRPRGFLNNAIGQTYPSGESLVSRSAQFVAIAFGIALLVSCSGSRLIPGDPRVPVLPDTFPFKTSNPSSTASFPTNPLVDSKVHGYANSILKKVKPKASKEPYTITVFKTSWVQGLSFGNGMVGVSRGMLNMMLDEAELACVVGHEVAHTELHQAEKRAKNQRDANRTRNAIEHVTGSIPGTGSLVGNVIEIAKSGWSQELEQEADDQGALYCAQAGYDPYALVDLFDRLAARVKRDPLANEPAYQKTHKSLPERSTHLRAFLKEKGYLEYRGKREYRKFRSGLLSLATIREAPAGRGTGAGSRFMQVRIDQDAPLWSNWSDSSVLDPLNATEQTKQFNRDRCDGGGADRGFVPNRAGDAFGHCWYGCEATRLYGPYVAEAVGLSYETARDSGIPSPHESHTQDVYNNEMGIISQLQYETDGLGPVSCLKQCEALENAGLLDETAVTPGCWSCESEHWVRCPDRY